MIPVPYRALVLVALTALGSSGQTDRPAEADIFGPTDGGTQTPSQPAAGKLRDDQELGNPTTREAFGEEGGAEDPLKIGGLLYQRAIVVGYEQTSAANTRFTAPMVVDTYLDARPNGRLRGFILGRLRYDPTIDTSSSSTSGPSAGPTSLFTNTGSNPSVTLDQLWLKFDIERVVFLTAGKQHVKWGASRFWNPTDFLHVQRRDPLAPFDLRTGTTMVKANVPWESKGWNFYAVGLLDNVNPASTLGQLGGAIRGEIAFGNAAIGAEWVGRNGRKPAVGADVSFALGPFDLYGEVALRKGNDGVLWRKVGEPDPQLGIAGQFESYSLGGITTQVSGGANVTFAYMENQTVILGAEYFYNQLGSSSASVYPWLLFQGAFQPFYLGKHYGSTYATTSIPGYKDRTNVALSNIGNFSDLSFITRLDFSVRVLQYLNLETYGAVHYGNRGGEFRFAVDQPSYQIGGQTTPPIFVPAPTFEFGVGARINI